MNDPEELRPQIAVLSSSADQDRVRPLVDELRKRGVALWWDGDGVVPGVAWREKVEVVIGTTPIICLAISERALASDTFNWVIDRTLSPKRVLVPLRLERIDTAHMPKAISDRMWVDLIEAKDLEPAVQQLERTVRSIAGPAVSEASNSPSGQRSTASKSSGAEQSGAATKASASSGSSSGGMVLLLGDSASPETWSMGADLRRTLEQAARLHPKSTAAPRHPISFATLLASLFWTGTPWSQWCHGVAKQTSFDTTKLRAIPVTPAEVSTPLRATTSVATLLGTAREYAQRSSTTLDVHHLIAALCFAPAGHESDLDSYAFDALAWANALIEETSKRFSSDSEVFRELRDETFPPPEPEPEPERKEPKPDDGSSVAEPTAVDATWTAFDAELKEAVAWAALASTTRATDPGVVSVQELFGGVLAETTDEVRYAELLAAAASSAAASPSEAAWSWIERQLGMPRISGAAPLPALPPCSEEVGRAFARVLALRATPDAPVTCTLVFLSLLRPENAGESAVVDPLLAKLGVEPEPFLRSLLQAFDEKQRAEAVLVRDILALRRAYQLMDRPLAYNDRVSGAISPDKDLLDARKPALRFARLLAAKDVAPPIALGLFGNWGSGKTFFMGLMRDRIQDLAKNGGPHYVRRVAQIEFNAWHYHDTNLWASLAVRIFDGLADELGGEKETDVAAKRRELHQRIRSSKARRIEAKKRRREASERRASAAKRLEKKESERKALYDSSVKLQLVAAWRVVTRQDSTRFRKWTDAAQRVREEFGINAALTSAEDVRRFGREVEATRQQASGLQAAVAQRFHGRTNAARTVGMLVLAALVLMAFGWGVEEFVAWRGIRVPAFSSTLLQVSAAITGIVAWCSARLKDLRGALDTVAEIDTALAEEAGNVVLDPELDQELIGLKAEIQTLDKQIQQARDELSATEREIAEATAEIDRINRGGLVYDFLQERKTAANYVGQLGLISTIRQDLDRLEVLLEDFGKNGKDPIERIILYIDDLDRCHPDKVVEVLQAVHLLLAFDLFNVVVGVDARWLERSLKRQYVGDSDDAAVRSADPFSPRDYLEKIFQIPYALDAIDKTGFKNLIDDLIETRTDRAESERKSAAEAAAKRAAEAEAAAKALAAKKALEEGKNEHEDEEDRGETDADPKRGKTADDAEDHDDESKDETSQPQPSTVPEPQFFFEDHEQAFIETLYAFIDRPRLAKRFVNIYRLLRVRADDEHESERFARSASSSDYRAALILLAIHVGHPAVAAKLTQALVRALKGCTWPGVLTELEQGLCAGIACSEPEREEFARIVAKLAGLEGEIPLELDSYRRWAPRVACYSFDWHRADGATGASVNGRNTRGESETLVTTRVQAVR